MKKLLFLLSALLLLPLSMTATGPARMDLQPNQKLLGHYTTDDIALGGCWGKTTFKGVVIPIATDLTPEELALFQGSKIIAFRVGLSTTVPVSRVFVIPIDANGTLGEVTEWPCEVDAEGWNLIELDEPYLINLPADSKLRIGFDFCQQEKNDKPISAVNVGTIYNSYCYRAGSWTNYGLSQVGNLSLQCVCENDNFPAYVIQTRDLYANNTIIAGTDLSFGFQVCNKGEGEIPAGGCVFNVAIDGNIVTTVTNPTALSENYSDVAGTAPTDGLTEGMHTLTVYPATANGEAIEYPAVLSFTFKVFAEGFMRQMRLVEQFTSTYCTYCPRGSAALQALTEMRPDIAWVGVHQNMSGTDPMRTVQCDSIANLQGCTGYPEASFDRATGFTDNTSVCNVISYSSATGGAREINNFLNSIDTEPAWSTININSTFDPETRKANIIIDGELVKTFDEVMGSDAKLTVYITEDGIVARQLSSGTWVENYVHNGVLRRALGSVKGVNLNRDGDTYKNEFTYTIPTGWNADNLNIVAFISRPLGGPLTKLRVDQAMKRKLGEFDEVTSERGDVDGNGEVTIDDVTGLINFLLTDDATGVDLDAADCNLDTRINIEDVTELINFLLTDNWSE